jgi:hypothetical protein
MGDLRSLQRERTRARRSADAQRPGNGEMTGESTRAARMREVQWALDDAAYRLPRDEVADYELDNLADQLIALAHLLRPDDQPEAVDGAVVSVVIEQ